MAEYKLIIVEKYPDLKEQNPPDGEVHIVTIGYFETEHALARWANENEGEIDKV